MRRCYPGYLDQLMGAPCPLHCNAGGGGGKGGSAPAPPPIPAPEPIPDTRMQEAEGKSVRDTEKQRLRQLRGMGGAMLTSPEGALGAVQSQGSGLLGRSGV